MPNTIVHVMGINTADATLSLRAAIPRIAADPRDANRIFVAVLGHPYGPNAERGIYRSTDGGRTLERVLYVDENTGGADVQIGPFAVVGEGVRLGDRVQVQAHAYDEHYSALAKHI